MTQDGGSVLAPTFQPNDGRLKFPAEVRYGSVNSWRGTFIARCARFYGQKRRSDLVDRPGLDPGTLGLEGEKP
jgi:hypothetical protein